MAYECDGCRKRFDGQPRISITGRKLCPACDDQLLGMTAGAIVGGIPGAISTAGWYARVKALRRKDKKPT